MRFNLLPPSLLSLLTVTLVRPTTAGLIPDLLDRFEDLQSYVKRCENPCGYYGQLCCTQGEYCYTDNLGQAQCGSGSAQTQAQVTGVYTYYTTTYVLTNLQTVTSTWSSLIPTVTATAISCPSFSFPQRLSRHLDGLHRTTFFRHGGDVLRRPQLLLFSCVGDRQGRKCRECHR
jgi:hypothetical protein